MGELHLNPGEAEAWTRRRFLASGLAMASAAATVPQFLTRSASGLPMPVSGASSIPGVAEDRILVVVQLSGGNDGLNTVIPYRNDAYYRVRPGIAIGDGQVLRMGEHDIGLHPSLGALKSMYDDGQAAIVQGVGYPNPNRSHFKSMDIWHTADTNGTGDGWLGRYVDSQCCGYGAGESGRAEPAPEEPATPEPAIAIGNEAPLALMGQKTQPVSFETADLFRWVGERVHPSLGPAYESLVDRGPGAADAGSNASFLLRTAMDARIASETIREAVEQEPLVNYPQSNIGRQLSMIGSMIRAGLGTRVYYVSHGSFDTHAAQGGAGGRHSNLLQQWSSAIGAFYRDLEAQGNAQRVLTMSFSEFGRRVGQNASGGTDHGTAAPMFLFGPMVSPGVWGTHPSLTDLDQGDLRFNLDFRSVYADVLTNWLSGDAQAALGGRFKPTKLIRG